ncbi:hypothetical protein ELG87_14890 [Rhizobium leguminosarum]|uniref:hypothetical protein n=1 Tax=Rhizobium leguminosarum TaxID=384 RepID=UPI001031D62F|nr:hypothetical protein [Rhizobium leguminosarum]TBF57626.1 hypothetical protein ELG87_14890 [Rhizobium leguminosarum]
MTFRRSRIGNAPSKQDQAPASVVPFKHERSAQAPDFKPIVTVSHRGRSPAQINEFWDDEIMSSPIILNNIDKIDAEFIAGKGKSTLKTYKKKLKFVVRFIETANKATKRNIISAADFSPDVLRLMILHCGADGRTYEKLSTFRRFLKAIGVDPSLIPTNTKKAPKPKEKVSIPASLLRAIINHFKHEMHLIISRYNECHSLLAIASDPRKRKGVRKGDWGEPASRVWAIVNLIGLDLKNVMTARKDGLRTAMSVFEERPGAMCLLTNNVHRRVGGVAGHLAWFYPSQRDLLPFVMLLLVRTRAGYAIISGLAKGQYHFRHLALEWNAKPDTVAQLSVQKFRTKSKVEKDPEIYRCLTLVRPVSHAYQLVKFLEKLSEPLRGELFRQIGVLKRQRTLSAEQSKTLARLERIKDDLFIYATYDTIFSLSEHEGIPAAYRDSLNALKFPTNTKSIRSSELASGVKLFGDDAAMASILGDHQGTKTFKHYTKERELRERSEAQFIEIFDKSVALIEAEVYSKKNVKDLLSQQGASPQQIVTLITGGILTHWGNRCSDPFFPPEQFGGKTPPGKPCVGQNCIEGCPRARWFPDASSLLRMKIGELEEKLLHTNFLTAADSVLHAWLDRCNRLLSIIEKRSK